MPIRHVPVLQRRLRQVWRGLTGICPVGRSKLARQNFDRPPVANQMVESQAEHVVGGGDPEDPCSHQEPAVEIEWPGRLAAEQVSKVVIAPGPVLGLEWHLHVNRMHDLNEAASATLEHSAECIVPSHEKRECTTQGRFIERPPQADGKRDVVRGA